MRLRPWMIFIAAAIWLWWPAGSTKPLDLVAGTTPDTFAILDRESGRLTEVTQRGEVVRGADVRLPAKDVRIVGSKRGAVLVWPEGKRIAVADVDWLDNKELFGKRVEKLCSQAASTDMMFGVGWLERDGSIWILRVDSFPRQLVPSGGVELAETASPYCGVTNADHGIALLYLNGSRYELVRCPEGKRCGNPRKVSISSGESILGYACTWHFCMIASRARSGTTTLHWLDERAKTITKRPLEASKDFAVNVAGEGETFSVAYSDGNNSIVEHSSSPGQLRRIFAGGDPITPALAYMGNMLLIAAQRDGKLFWETIVL